MPNKRGFTVVVKMLKLLTYVYIYVKAMSTVLYSGYIFY